MRKLARQNVSWILVTLALGCGGEIGSGEFDEGDEEFAFEELPLATAGTPLLPAADAMVRSGAYATANYGARAYVYADLDQDATERQVYLRFDLSSITGTISRATLQLFVADTALNSADVYAVSNTTWGEFTINWSNKPLLGTKIGTIGATSYGTWVEVDVTSAAVGKAAVSFALRGRSADAFGFPAKEGGTNKPRLLVETSTGTVTQPQHVGFIPSPAMARDVVVDAARRLAYVASDNVGLTVVDLTNTGAPVAVGGTKPSFWSSTLAAQGNRVVISATEGTTEGLRVVDVSDPRSPRALGFLPGAVRGLALSGQYAYARLSVAGSLPHMDFAVIDLSNPASPRLVSQVYLSSGKAVKVVGSYAYVTISGGLQIYDITNPLSPQSRGTVTIPNGAMSLEVAGNTAYVGNNTTIYTVDVTSAMSPQVVGSVAAYGKALSVAGTRLYALTGNSFKIVDVSNRATPRVIGTWQSPDFYFSAWGIAAYGSTVLMANPEQRTAGLYLVDAAQPSAPFLRSSLDGYPGCSAVGASGTLAVVSTGNGLQTIDISNPALPSVMGNNAAITAKWIAMSGSYAYISIPVAGSVAHYDLGVVDLRAPSNPVLLSQTYFASATRMEVNGGYLYVRDSNTLRIFDLVNPAAPRARGSLVLPNSVPTLAVSGTMAYLGTAFITSPQVYAVDVSNPDNPVLRGSIPLPTIDITAVGTKLYVLTNSTLNILDASNPAAMRVVGTTNGLASSWGIEVVGNRAFTTSIDKNAVMVVDVSNSALPRVVSQLQVPKVDHYSITKSGNYVYAGDHVSLVNIIQAQ